MKDINSYSKISERLAVLLCDSKQRNPGESICQHEAIAEVEPYYKSGHSIASGIRAWLAHRGTPVSGWGAKDRTVVYPVGGCLVEAHAKFWNAHAESTMWRGKYGQERKELLRFLIQWYREKGL